MRIGPNLGRRLSEGEGRRPLETAGAGTGACGDSVAGAGAEGGSAGGAGATTGSASAIDAEVVLDSSGITGRSAGPGCFTSGHVPFRVPTLVSTWTELLGQIVMITFT